MQGTEKKHKTVVEVHIYWELKYITIEQPSINLLIDISATRSFLNHEVAFAQYRENIPL